jgi:hypothetical protein
MEVFTKVWGPFVEVVTLEPNVEQVHNFNIDFLVKKHSMRLLDYE